MATRARKLVTYTPCPAAAGCRSTRSPYYFWEVATWRKVISTCVNIHRRLEVPGHGLYRGMDYRLAEKPRQFGSTTTKPQLLGNIRVEVRTDSRVNTRPNGRPTRTLSASTREGFVVDMIHIDPL